MFGCGGCNWTRLPRTAPSGGVHDADLHWSDPPIITMARNGGHQPLPPRPNFRWRLIAACAGSLMGIPSTRHADVERVLRSNLNLRYVAAVVALRLLRKIGGLAARIGAVARRLRGSGRNVEDRSVASKQSAIELQLHRDEGEALRIPIISTSPARRPFPCHIFQTWKSKTQVPENYARWSQSVRIRNANFDYFLW